MKQDFYGNDGVCLFKYFVHKDDPQKEFAWAILIVNFLCFVFISVSYILISAISKDSSKNLANSQDNVQINQRNRKMNRRIAIIVATDFCCWIPFIVICLLHFLEVLDATSWYSIFSMIILPINSVINPLLYDDFIAGMIRATSHLIVSKITNSTIYENCIARYNASVHSEAIEMDQINVQQDGTRSGKKYSIEAANVTKM
jgi:hypothetical protein